MWGTRDAERSLVWGTREAGKGGSRQGSTTVWAQKTLWDSPRPVASVVFINRVGGIGTGGKARGLSRARA